LLGVAVIPVTFVLCGGCSVVYWVGSADLEVVFVVVEAHSQQPIVGALVEVRSEKGGFCGDREQEVGFQLLTDATGRARRECADCMCYGRSSLVGRNTFGTHVPGWVYRVSAPGWASSGWLYLENHDHTEAIQRLGAGKARLVVRIPLQEPPA
jgi:hypothetical protein